MAGRLFAFQGLVRYNGYTFPPAKSCKVVSEPQYDSANRTVKWVEYTITVETIVVSGDITNYTSHEGIPVIAIPGTPIDNRLDSIRALLQRPGGVLCFTHQGFGDDFFVNTGDGTVDPEADTGAILFGRKVDVSYGPRPELLIWEPIAGNLSARIIWTCVVHIPECSYPAHSGQLMEYTYSVDWAISNEGMSTRTISGKIEIPANRLDTGSTASTGISDNADRYRDLIQVNPLPGFHREQTYKLSLDKRFEEFRIVDTEIPSDIAFEPGCVKMEASHEISSGFNTKGLFQGTGFVQWKNTMDATITLAPGTPRNTAWTAFLTAFNDRVSKLDLAPRSVEDHDREKLPELFGKYWVWFLKIRESLYSREFRFTINWTTWCKLSKVWEFSRVFIPLNENDWSEWVGSMNVAFDRRGYAQLKSDIADDTLVDLCSQNTPAHNSFVYKTSGEEEEGDMIDSLDPDAEDSWGAYESSFYPESESNSIIYPKIQQTSPDEIQDEERQEEVDLYDMGFKIGKDPTSVDNLHYLQMRGKTIWRVRMKGYAIRRSYSIPCPTLRSFGGVLTYASGGRWMHRMIVPSQETPVYAAAWDRVYYLTGTPATAEDLMSRDRTSTTGKPERFV